METRNYVWLALLLLLAIGLQVTAASQKDFWEDEAFTAVIAQETPPQVITRSAGDVHPPLYFLATHYWGKLFGYTELPLRLFSIVFVTLTVLMVYALTTALFNHRAALFAATLFVLAPASITYGHMVRYYSLTAFLTLSAVLATYHYHRSFRREWLLLYVAACTTLVYVVYSGWFVVLGCFLWGVVQWKAQREQVKKLALWSVTQMLMPILFAPWLLTFAATVQARTTSGQRPELSLVELAKRVGYLGYTFSVGETLAPVNPVAIAGVVLVGGIGVVALVRGRGNRHLWMVLGFFAILEAGNVAVNMVTVYPQSAFQALPYRTFYALPFFVMVLAYGLARMNVGTRAILGVALLAVYGVSFLNYLTGQQFMRPLLTVPWRQIVGTIQAEAATDAIVMCNTDYACQYYVARYGFEVHRPRAWTEVAAPPASEVWWIQTNLGTDLLAERETADAQAFHAMSALYGNVSATDYAPHDPAVRQFKELVSQQEDYEYRVTLFRFSDPVTSALPSAP